MKYRAQIPYDRNSVHVGRVGWNPCNRYWVRIYKWDEDSGQYKAEISDSFVNRDDATELFRSIHITKDTPRAEIWAKFRDEKLKLMTYKGLPRESHRVSQKSAKNKNGN